MTIKPIDDRVAIEPIEEAEKSVGGIIIPDTAKEKPQIGKVIAIGTDKEIKDIVKVGDDVLYAKYGGTEIETDGKKVIILSRSDMLAIVE